MTQTKSVMPMLAAADTVDPSRLLLQDQKRAEHLLAKASGYWEQASGKWRQTWLAINGARLSAQVAALQAVADS